MQPNTETVERTIEGTALESIVHVLGSDPTESDETESAWRQWLPSRRSVPRVSASERGLSGPFLLVDLGALLNSFRDRADGTAVGEAATELVPEPEEETSGRSKLSRVLFLGVVLGVAYALRNRFRSIEDPAEETENLAQKAADRIQQRGEVAAERIEESSRVVAERIEERGEETAERMSEAAETVEQVEEEAAEAVEDVEEEASETAEEAEEESESE